MNAQLVAARSRLRQLDREHPDWTHRQVAEEMGYSRDWVRKWRKRLRAAAPDDETVLWGQSCARKTPCVRVGPTVIERILEIRDHPPENLQRVPGPRAILYYLQRDPTVALEGVYLPRSTRTVWKILDQHGRIYHPPLREHEPVERPAPMQAWQIDFKDVSSVPPEPEGKAQHVVETLNAVDCGTSLLVAAMPRHDYTAKSVVLTLAEVFRRQGIPQDLTFDRDPRFVGSWSGQDFPAAFVRFVLCLGVRVHICPPHRPDKNAFVERYHRSYKEECLEVHQPTTLAETREVTQLYQHHYNHERPNQALTCDNRPPAVAHTSLPKLPPLPAYVNPDRWLEAIHGQYFRRRVRADGTVTVNNERYYIQQALRGQEVMLYVDALEQTFVVWHTQQTLKKIPIKRLYQGLLTFDDYLSLICKEAETERSRYLRYV